MTNGKKQVIIWDVPTDKSQPLKELADGIGLENELDRGSFLVKIFPKKTIEIHSKENHTATDEFLRCMGYIPTEIQDGRRYDFQHKESTRVNYYREMVDRSPNLSKLLNSRK